MYGSMRAQVIGVCAYWCTEIEHRLEHARGAVERGAMSEAERAHAHIGRRFPDQSRTARGAKKVQQAAERCVLVYSISLASKAAGGGGVRTIQRAASVAKKARLNFGGVARGGGV